MILSLIGTVIAFAMAFHYYLKFVEANIYCERQKRKHRIIYAILMFTLATICACFIADFLTSLTTMFYEIAQRV